MPKFDTSHIKDVGLKHMYDYLLLRGEEVVDSLSNSYLVNKNKIKVTFSYQISTELNAVARWKNKQYHIEIDSPTVFLTRNLLDSLITCTSSILPEIQDKEKKHLNETLPYTFIADPCDLSNQQSLEYCPDRDRLRLSHILADLCASFVLFHEIGHVVCGHVQGSRYYFNKNYSPKFIEWFYLFHRGFYLRRSMEYDADMVATVLLMQYIEDLENKIRSGQNRRLQEVFSAFLYSEPEYLLEKLTSIVTISLYAFFTYIAGRGALKFNEKSIYPHPMVRAMYIKDGLVLSAQRTRTVSKDILLKYNLKYFDQFDDALKKLNLHQPYFVMDEVLNNLDNYTDEIKSYADRFRRFTKKWAWLPYENWE